MLPSNISIYTYAPIVNFDQLEPRLVRPPSQGLRAWRKLQELERRLDFFDWVLYVAREPSGLTTLLCDCASAFIMSYEAAIQLFRHEAGSAQAFDRWLEERPANTYLVRGLRTQRHLEAHIRASAMTPNRSKEAYTRFAGGIDGGRTTSWHFDAITVEEWRQLARPRLREDELPLWAALVADLSAQGIMFEGLRALVHIFEEAEATRTTGNWP